MIFIGRIYIEGVLPRPDITLIAQRQKRATITTRIIYQMAGGIGMPVNVTKKYTIAQTAKMIITYFAI